MSKTVEEKKTAELQKSASDDKWQSLKAYRCSKGLCFICGEKWNREHQCKNTIQLHVVQEMIAYMQASEDADSVLSEPEVSSPNQQVMMLSLAAMDPGVLSVKSMQLLVDIQGQQLLFLVDSGSSTCFIDCHRAQQLSGRQPLVKPVSVKVAGGAILQCDEYFPHLEWTAAGTKFTDQFRILPLGSYDGIIGLGLVS